MTEAAEGEELSEITKKTFIMNSIFGQKLINNLSHSKSTKKEVNIDYFINHINHFNNQKKDNLDKINFKKHIDSLPSNILDKIKEEAEPAIKIRNHIEPYCKKQLKLETPVSIFKKNGYHYKLVKLESHYFDLMSIIYYNEDIVGYICCGKKSNSGYNNLFIVICSKYEKDFYDKQNKKMAVISEITEEIGFYEKETYSKYLKNFRFQLFAAVLDILTEHKNLRNIVCIGEEEGGNLLQLFLIDFINNKGEALTKISDDISFYLFNYNTAILSTETFYNDLLKNLGDSSNSIITCFSDKNDAYNSWDFDENKKIKYNVIIM